MLDKYKELVSQISEEDIKNLQNAESLDDVKEYLKDKGYDESIGNNLEKEIRDFKPNLMKGMLRVLACIVSVSMIAIGIVFFMLFSNATEPAIATVIGYDEVVSTRLRGNKHYEEHTYAPIVSYEVSGEIIEQNYRKYGGEDIMQKYQLNHTYNIKYDLSDPTYFEFEGGNTRVLGIIFIVLGMVSFLIFSGTIKKIIKR